MRSDTYNKAVEIFDLASKIDERLERIEKAIEAREAPPTDDPVEGLPRHALLEKIEFLRSEVSDLEYQNDQLAARLDRIIEIASGDEDDTDEDDEPEPARTFIRADPEVEAKRFEEANTNARERLNKIVVLNKAAHSLINTGHLIDAVGLLQTVDYIASHPAYDELDRVRVEKDFIIALRVVEPDHPFLKAIEVEQ